MAQNTPAHRSYIIPFPNGDRYRVAVFGDKMAEGLWDGLYRAFEDDPTVDFIQLSQRGSGFRNPKKYNWNAEINQILKDGNYHAAVVLFGMSEGQTLRKDKEALKFGTEEWREAYGKRLETFIKKLRSAGVATYPSGSRIDSVDALIRAADSALYRAKDAGRNRVVQNGSGAASEDGAGRAG